MGCGLWAVGCGLLAGISITCTTLALALLAPIIIGITCTHYHWHYFTLSRSHNLVMRSADRSKYFGRGRRQKPPKLLTGTPPGASVRSRKPYVLTSRSLRGSIAACRNCTRAQEIATFPDLECSNHPCRASRCAIQIITLARKRF